jgi:hypothetical protein
MYLCSKVNHNIGCGCNGKVADPNYKNEPFKKLSVKYLALVLCI